MDRQLLTRLRWLFQLAFVLALLYFVGRTAYQRWDDVQKIQTSLSWVPIALGTVLTIGFTFALSASWQWLVRRLAHADASFSAIRLHRTFLTSFLTRYLPAGTLFNIGGKIELLRREGGARSLGAASVLYEFVFLMGGGLFLAWFAFLAYPAPRILGEWQSLYVLVLVLGAGGWILCFAVPDRVIHLFNRLLRRQDPELGMVHWRVVDRAAAFVIYVLVNGLQGLAVLMMLVGVYPDMPQDPGIALHVVAAYPLARLVGQAAPFAPGGIGVREATFALLVAPWLPLQPVLVASALMRLLSILIEVTAAGVFEGLARYQRGRPPLES